MKQFTLLALSCAVHVLFLSSVQAQYVFATVMETPLAPATGVDNTGCDVVEYAGAPLHAFCWDGATSEIAIEYSGLVLTSPLQMPGGDPDIVIDPRNITNRRILVVYTLNTDIYYEQWEFNGATLNPVTPPMLLYSNSLNCNNPNVDVARNGEVAMTFHNGANAMGMAAPDINTAPMTLSPAHFVDLPCISLCNAFFPDVKISFDATTGRTHTSFTFIWTEGGFIPGLPKELGVHTLPTDSLYSTGMLSCITYDALYNTVAPQHSMGRPRIAGPVETLPGTDSQPSSTKDYEVVVQTIETADDLEFIHGFNDYYGTPSHYILNTNNSDPFPYTPQHAIYHCGNHDPAVAASANYLYQTSWTYHPGNTGCYYDINGTHNIPTRKLDFSGVKQYQDYSIANMDLNGDRIVSSVAGRFHPWNEMLYFFHDVGGNQMFFKSINIGSQPLKRDNEQWIEPENPIANRIVNGEVFVSAPTTIRLYSMNGALSYSEQLMPNESRQLNDVLPSGIYILQQEVEEGILKPQKVYIH